MVAYGADELIPSSEFAKKFGSYLAKIKEHSVEKLAILKNNKVEAVLVSKDDYEAMCEALEKLETHEEIKHIENAFKRVELIKSGKMETFPIEELWDKMDD